MSEVTLAECACVCARGAPSKHGVDAVSFRPKWPSLVSILMYVTGLPPNKEVAAGWIPVSDKSLGTFVCVCIWYTLKHPFY